MLNKVTNKVNKFAELKNMIVRGGRKVAIIIAFAPVAFTACDKPIDEPPVPPLPTRDIIIEFGLDKFDDVIVPSSIVKNAAAPADVRNVILQSDDKPLGFSSTTLKNIILEPAFNASPKVIGRGHLHGIVIKDIADSTWFVAKGFTVNQRPR